MAELVEPMQAFRLSGRKQYTGHFCQAPYCSNTSGNDKDKGVKRSYFSFPLKDEKRLRLWLRAIPRDEWTPSKNERICSDHFIAGKKTNEPGSDGYIPTIFTGADRARGKKEGKPRSSRTSKAADFVPPPPETTGPDMAEAAPAPLGRPTNPKPAQDNETHEKCVWINTEHDYVKTRIEPGPPTILETVEQKLMKKDEEIAALKGRTISHDVLDDSEFPLWTNMPSRAVFTALLTYLESRGAADLKVWRGASTIKHVHFTEKGMVNKPGPPRTLSVADELFMVLVKLKTGFSNEELARLVGVSDTTISQTFTTYATFIAVELRHLFEMPLIDNPEADAACFKEYDNLRTIIDCTEVFIEKAHNLQSQKEMYSNYKHHETIKFLVGMSPQLSVNYVSAGYGGRASDKHVTLLSAKLIDGLPEGSAVMADRGFNIGTEFAEKGVRVYIPEYKGRGRTQMTNAELAKSEHIAEARIHIERIIQRIRTFHILDTRAKLSMQDVFEQIFVCCAYLTNFQTSIIKS